MSQPIKIFIVAYLRDLEQQVTKGHISYSRMVEILNEKANEHVQAERDLAEARLGAINELLNTIEINAEQKQALEAKISDLEADVGGGKLYEHMLESEIAELKTKLTNKTFLTDQLSKL